MKGLVGACMAETFSLARREAAVFFPKDAVRLRCQRVSMCGNMAHYVKGSHGGYDDTCASSGSVGWGQGAVSRAGGVGARASPLRELRLEGDHHAPSAAVLVPTRRPRT